MSDEFITAKHIEKLSHHIPEIRERALLNIYSKLQRNIFYDNDLARSKELFWQLCNWFRENEPPIRHDGIVLKILKRIIKSESGIYLIDLHSAHELIKEFNELKNIVNEDSQCHLLEIIKYLQDMSERPQVVVPPLNLTEINSNRSSDAEFDTQVTHLIKDISTTATTMVGIVENDSFVSLQGGHNNMNLKPTQGCQSIKSNEVSKLENPFRYFTFLWQWLIGADRHVLESVENTLRNPTEPSELLNSFEFISDVLLHDFPAEVFLQRPAIVKQLHDLLWSSPSSRITTAILKCLAKLTKAFISRIRYYDNPGTHNLKLNNFHIETPNNTPHENDDSSSSEVETISETMTLMKHQMNLPQFCLNTINAVFDYLYVNPDAGDTFQRKKCQIGINTALVLLHNAIKLVKLSVKSEIFDCTDDNTQNIEVINTLKKFDETFHKFGEVLTHFRIKVLAEDFPDETRLIQLHLLANFLQLHTDFIPETKTNSLPINLKACLSETLLDASLSRLFPSLHRNLFELSKSFITDATYDHITVLCASMTSTIKFLREWKSLPFTKNVSLVQESLKSLEFHKNLHLVSIFIDLCANKLTTHTFHDDILYQCEDILSKLLSHHDLDIRTACYKECHAKVLKTIGAKLNVSKSSAPGSQILFLLRGKIISLITVQSRSSLGSNVNDDEIQKYCEDILVHVLKAKLLMSEEMWRETVTALMPSVPLLLTHCGDKKSLIGRHVLALLDPDRCRLMNFSAVEVLRLNVGLLFVKSCEVRMEAASRLCWLLSSVSQAPSDGSNTRKEVRMLPHLNNLHDKVLADVCNLDRKLDFKTYKNQTHFYQPSSLHQVLDLLSSDKVEPVIRRSAITQVSVMAEDPLLHSILLDRDGLELIKHLMQSALTDEDYKDYPDSAIPCLCILKNVCLYSATTRQKLANDADLLHLILRGIFMFCAEPRVKQDGAALLFLIVFNEYVRGTPAKNDLNVVDVLQNGLMCPFEVKGFNSSGNYALESLTKLKQNKWALSSLQIHWNIEYFQGLDQLLQPKLNYFGETSFSRSEKFSDDLKLTPVDLRAVKSTCMQFTINKCLDHIYQSHCHDVILKNLHLLSRCITLNDITADDVTTSNDFQWEKSFTRFLNTPPAGEQDNLLLSVILDFFSILIPHLQSQNLNLAWFIALLTSKTHYFNVLLSVELSQEQELTQDVEKLLNSLLNLINIAVMSEQTLFDLPLSTRHTKSQSVVSLQTTTSLTATPPPAINNKYSHIVKILVHNLQSSNTKHFYNLAYLDRLLKSLTHLTATFGWSDSKNGESLKQVMVKMATSAFELLNAFHCGKGPTAADTFMGLSITRNVVLVLNHLVAEMQHYKLKDWEECFVDLGVEMENGSVFRSVFVLRNSRDVVLRAAAVNLMSGWAMSCVCCVGMIQDIADKKDYLYLWKVTLSILCDHDESAIVRENAALLLTNLSSHAEQDGGQFFVLPGILTKIKAQPKQDVLQETQKKILVALLDSCNFFKEIDVVLKRLITQTVFNCFRARRQELNSNLDEFMFVYNKVLEVSNMSDSLNPNHEATSTQKFYDTFGITIPGVVKALATFLSNLLCVLPQTISKALQGHALIKLFFKCVCLPNIELKTTRDFMSYADLLQMNTAICTILAKTANNNENCLLTIGNARDCLNTIIALLDPDIYVITLPELHYLRNKLWSSIFNLINILLRGAKKTMEQNVNNKPTERVNSSVITKYDTNALIHQLESHKEPFLLSLCESISSDMSNDLQLSALNSLSSLLKCDKERNANTIFEETEDVSDCQTTRSSVQLLLDTTRTPRFDSPQKLPSRASTKCDLLKEIYFGTKNTKTRTRTLTKSSSSLSLSSLSTENDTMQNARMAGAELCKILLQLYESLLLQSSTTTTQNNKKQIKSKRKPTVLNTLTNLLLVSNEAKQFALDHGLVCKVIQQLQGIYVQLSLENVDSLRKVAEKKRLLPILQELESLLGLMMNFLFKNEDVKTEAAHLGLTDLLHKLWVWFCVPTQKVLHITALKLLCTLTTNCEKSAASLALTSSVPGSGPKKAPSNNSLLHVVCALVAKEMDLVSRTHDLVTLKLAFHVLHNAVQVSECRFIIVKANFMAAVSKLHPALTKRQKPWEAVEMMWLQFLNDFSAFAEGQMAIGKGQDVFEIVLCLCCCPNVANRLEALQVLRNIAFYQGNRTRLLASDDFLNILSSRLSAAIPEEVAVVIPAIWALVANCQRAKMVFKAARLDAKIQDYLRVLHLNNYANITEEEVEIIRYVLTILTQG